MLWLQIASYLSAWRMGAFGVRNAVVNGRHAIASEMLKNAFAYQLHL